MESATHSFFDWYLSNFPFKFLFPSFPPKWLPPNGLNSSKSESDDLEHWNLNSLKKPSQKFPHQNGKNVCLGDIHPGVGSRWCSPPFPPLREDPELGPGEISTNLFFIQVLHLGGRFIRPQKNGKNGGFLPRMDGWIYLGVSKNRGKFPPKWMVKIMQIPYNIMEWFGGKTLLFLETPIWKLGCFFFQTPIWNKNFARHRDPRFWGQREHEAESSLGYLFPLQG